MSTTHFRNRHDAGNQLGSHLAGMAGDIVVMALPRGGVPVAAEVARRLGAPLDVMIVRKLVAPERPAVVFGAVAEHDIRILDDTAIARTGLGRRAIDEIADTENLDVDRQVSAYRRGRHAVSVKDRVVVVVDDGIVTGFTAKAALEALRFLGARSLILAVPVAAPEAVEELRALADEVIALETPSNFMTIGEWYDDFEPVSDDEVASLLDDVDHTPEPRPAHPQGPITKAVELDIEGGALPATLTVPGNATGVVVFALASGSSRRSPRTKAVAQTLQRAGLATLLLDLLTSGEAVERCNVFDIGLLAERLELARAWIADDVDVGHLPLGYLGVSTGGAAALAAAARPDASVAAVVCRGGRPDLVADELAAVRAPTLLIVGGRDRVVLERNREAQEHLRCLHTLDVVPGASHLFEEPGTLTVATHLAVDWFDRHFGTDEASDVD